jgi:hypothetical protein
MQWERIASCMGEDRKNQSPLLWRVCAGSSKVRRSRTSYQGESSRHWWTSRHPFDSPETNKKRAPSARLFYW